MADALEEAWTLLKQVPLPPLTNFQDLIDGATDEDGASELQQLHDEALPAMQDPEFVRQISEMLQSDAGKQLARHLMIKFTNMAHPDKVPDHLVYDKRKGAGVPEDTY
tara:strand:- start:1902 stop:2225 length:324 start_codon:yes stop_codon:yes gene_type:complete